MTVNTYISIFLSILSLAACDSYYVFPSQVSVANGEGLFLQVLPADEPLKSCSVRLGVETIPLIPGDSSQAISYWGDGLKEGQCGAIVHNFNSTAHKGKWIFQVINSQDTKRIATAEVTPLDTNKYHENITITGELGSEFVVRCEADELWYCILSNPTGQMVRSGSNCTQIIQNLKMNDVGQWKCAIGVSKAVQEQVAYINVKVQSIKTLDIGSNETEKAVNIYCNYLSQNLTYCRFERPDGKALTLAEGNSLERYTYFGNGIASNECGISIIKPLQSEDYGTWMCTLGLNENGRSGGFITLTEKNKRKNTLIATKDKNTEEDVFVLTGSPLTLDCAVDIALNYCWFKHPNGTRFNPRPGVNESAWKYDGESLLLGKCGMTVLNASIADSGKWICGMGVQNEMQATQDLQKVFSVTVAEIPFIENRTITQAMTGDWVILGCHSLQGEALEYCSFLAPNGTGYNLTPGQEKGRYSYYGTGLEYGHCGLIINTVKTEDYGMWQCGTILAKKDGVTLVRDLYLEQPSLLSSSAIGLIVGVVLAACLVAGFIFYRRRRIIQLRREERRETSLRPVALSMLSASSDETEIVNTNQPA